MHYLVTHLPAAWMLTVIHLRLSLVPVLAGLAIALPWGVLAWRRALLRRLTTVTASVVFTIPSLALFVVLPLLIPTRILDEANVIVALTLYTTALLVRAVLEALDAVPSQVRDAASAVGYRPIMRVLKVELPLSIPVLVAELRVVVVTNISMVSVGSVIGIGGLGTWFTEGYQANKSDQTVNGIAQRRQQTRRRGRPEADLDVAPRRAKRMRCCGRAEQIVAALHDDAGNSLELSGVL